APALAAPGLSNPRGPAHDRSARYRPHVSPGSAGSVITTSGERHAVSTTNPSNADRAGHRPRSQLPPGGRAGAGSAHGAERPDDRLLRAPRAVLEVPPAPDRPAPR